jgi:hypothetical protein
MRLGGFPHSQDRWLSRAIRGARLDRNPLRRGIDRLETCLLVGLFMALTAGAPFAVRAATHAAYGQAVHARQEQLATSHEVRAVLTSKAPPVSGYSLDASALTEATWTSFAGVHRSGLVPAEPGSPKGTTVAVWTDDGTGSLVSPPLTTAEAAAQADAAMVGAIVGTGLLYLVGAGLIVHLANRRRIAAWEADWQATAPMWNRQRW